MFDWLLCASTYKSVHSALRFAHSVDLVPGDHCVCLAGPRPEDLEAIKEGLKPTRTTVVLIHSEVDSLYFCRALGFLWALSQGYEAHYYVSCDDDIEFTAASAKIPDLLSRTDASLVSFRNNIKEHECKIEDGHWGFVDGNCMFASWETTLACGLPDATLDVPVTYFTEIEYLQRLRALTGKPHVRHTGSEYYHHHFRTEPDRMARRQWGLPPAMEGGFDLWRRKYSTEPRLGYGVDLDRMTELCPVDRMRQHLMFDGLWTDWDEIVNKYQGVVV